MAKHVRIDHGDPVIAEKLGHSRLAAGDPTGQSDDVQGGAPVVVTVRVGTISVSVEPDSRQTAPPSGIDDADAVARCLAVARRAVVDDLHAVATFTVHEHEVVLAVLL